MPKHKTRSKATNSDKPLSLSEPLPTIEDLHAQGKAIRARIPRESHGQWKPQPNRKDVLTLIEQSNVGRQQNLVPLRMGRMACSPFSFLRGAAGVMAYDLAKTPISGVNVVMDGD